MLSSIDFNSDTSLGAIEINHIGTNTKLAAKLQTSYLFTSQS